MRTVIHLLHEGVKLYGDMPYLGQKLGDSYTTWSFRQTEELSAAFAASLVALGFRKGDNVAILAEGQASWVIGEFGLLRAGCTAVPLSTKLSEEEIRFRLIHSESRAILISENNIAKLGPVLKELVPQPLVVGISPATPEFKALVDKLGLKEGEGFEFFDSLIERGRKQLAEQSIQKSLQELEDSLSESDTVTICYTSGTTGNPKGIMLTHLNYWDNAHNAAEVVPIETGWKSLIMLPLDHSFAHTVGMYIFLYKGLCMYFVDARGGPLAAMRNLPKNLLEVNPDFLLTVPALSGNFMKKMIQGVAEKGPLINGIFQRGLAAGIRRAGNGYNKPPLWVRIKSWFPWALANLLIFPKLRLIFGTDIKFCVGGGALLEIRQQEFFNAIGVPVYQGYGLTENSPIICSNSSKKYKFGSSGVIIPNLDVRIMKDDTTECPLGVAGQIVTRGGSVMKGYYKNPSATAETLRDGWLWSGDLGYKDPDGFLVVTGREKALLIAPDGEKYSPEVIEEAIINTSRYVDQIMAYNEQCRFTSVLVTLNVDALKAAVEAARMAGNVIRAPEIINMIREDLTAFRTHPDYAKIPPQWRPSSFAIIPETFGEAHGLVNSTMKLVRHKVRDFYRIRINELYAAQTADPLVPGNLAALKELGLGD